MKIAVLNITGGLFSGGYAKYLERLMPLLRERPEVERLDVFVPAQAVREGFEGWRNAAELKARVRELKPDVVFIPTARWLDCGDIPVVSMVRNMEPLEVPFGGNTLIEGVKNLARAAVARHACKRADRVIAVSGHVRDFLTSRWSLDPDRVGVVYHGVDETKTPVPVDLQGFPRRFLFTAGSIRPARGLRDIIDAMPDVDQSLGLVIGGAPVPGTHGHHASLVKRVERLGLAGRVFWAGNLKAGQMSWCFENCQAFVMTTRAEACPNTALEAMSHGALTISGTNPPMPEFFRDAATYYQIGDAASLAQAISNVLAAPEERRDALRRAARARAAEFTWQRTADGTIRELRKALQS